MSRFCSCVFMVKFIFVVAEKDFIVSPPSKPTQGSNQHRQCELSCAITLFKYLNAFITSHFSRDGWDYIIGYIEIADKRSWVWSYLVVGRALTHAAHWRKAYKQLAYWKDTRNVITSNGTSKISPASFGVVVYFRLDSLLLDYLIKTRIKVKYLV